MGKRALQVATCALTAALILVLVACSSSQETPSSTGTTTVPASVTSETPTPFLPSTTQPGDNGSAVTSQTTSTAASAAVVTASASIQAQYQVVLALTDVRAAASPDGAPVETFSQINVLGQLTTLPVIGPTVEKGGRTWYPVLLPMRPNGSTGWVSSAEVMPTTVTAAMVVHLSAHSLTLYGQGAEVATYPVGLGSKADPTPPGTFFVTGVLQPGDPDGAYGAYAIGTSAFSENLKDWPGGGVIGIHGTNQPSSIGKNVSHGCIRLSNADITALANAVTLGVPIFIQP